MKNLLKQEKIKLWNPPYTSDDGHPSAEHMQELTKRYTPLLGLSASEVGAALELIRVRAVERGKGNRIFRETSVATLELQLPRDCRKDLKSKDYLEMRLDVLVQELLDRIREEFGLKSVKLILNGKTLTADQRLNCQGVTNHSRLMVLKVSDAELKQQISKDEEEEKNQSDGLQRTYKGFQILSERDGSEDPDTMPFLEIADQKGNPLKIPDRERKALILAMGFHEKGRSLMKRKQYDNALCHLLQADHQFSTFGSVLLSSVDNYGVLQLDIVWCYRALEALSCLSDAKSRLQRAEECFLQCYGEQKQRLLQIKGNTGREEVLFLRLHLLQSLLSYVDGDDSQAQHQLSKVESLYERLRPDPEKMGKLMALGFTEREVRLGLRACWGDVHEAAMLISNRRQEREQLKQREQQRRAARMEAISMLTELGYSRKDAAQALKRANGDINRASAILLDSGLAAQASNNNTQLCPDQMEQLLDLGFEPSVAEEALQLTAGDVQSATQLLLDNQGVLTSPTMSSASSSPSSSSAPTPSSTSPEDDELVHELLGDISRHEEDYLDLTLDEEAELIAAMKGYLS